MASTGVSSGSEQSEIVQTAARLHKEQEDLQERLIDLELKIQEHKVVQESLEHLDKSRKCFRLIGGVLVERNVGQVSTAIKDNLENLQKAHTSHIELLKRKTKELQEFTSKHNIKVKSDGPRSIVIVND